MNATLTTIVMLIVSNVFMTLAWYGHLRMGELGITKNWPLYAVILFSWGIALFEYSFQVPANRIGYVGNGGPFTLVQLKVLQEAITLIVFTVVATFLFRAVNQMESRSFVPAARGGRIFCVFGQEMMVWWRNPAYSRPALRCM